VSIKPTATLYSAGARLIGGWLAEPVLKLVPVGRPCGYSVGLYALVGRGALGSDLRILYVGKTSRGPGTDIALRIHEHMRDVDKRNAATHYIVFPLVPDTPDWVIHRLEGDLARFFGVPRLCRRIPRAVGASSLAPFVADAGRRERDRKVLPSSGGLA
jgi:hypothetical protein